LPVTGSLDEQTLRAREREPTALDDANRELEAALRPGIDGLQPALLALAELRARNIQDALLASGEEEAAACSSSHRARIRQAAKTSAWRSA
jgi:hypothetical protein